jgi:hypothetical protein
MEIVVGSGCSPSACASGTAFAMGPPVLSEWITRSCASALTGASQTQDAKARTTASSRASEEAPPVDRQINRILRKDRDVSG